MVTARAPHLDRVFGALADPTRREILLLLSRAPLPVGTLAAAFPISRPAISKHLDTLERAGLVERMPQGRSNLCVVRPAPVLEATAWLEFYRTHWEGALERFALLVDAEEETP
jgi:DNA-binding transcriptional ArsR family regulator